MGKLLTIIVPIYNVEKYIKQCIESIMKQTYSNLDIILVDDGSTDSSGNICDEFSELDKRIRVIHKKNRGTISARTAGLLEAKSEFITFVDGDDWIKTTMYEEMMNLMLSNNVDMVISGHIRYWDNEDYGERIDNLFEAGLYDRQMIEEKVIPKMLWCKEYNNWALDPSMCNKIFKRSILLKIFEKLRNQTFYFGDDTSVIYPYVLESKKICFTHECYYFHRQREHGILAPYITKENFFEELSNVYLFLKEIFKANKQEHILLKQLDYFFIRAAAQRKWMYNDMEGSSFTFLFPFDKVNRSSRIIIYGAGRVGQEYYEQIEKLNYCDIILWVDKNYRNFHDGRVHNINEIFNTEYDYIVIANMSDKIKMAIVKKLLDFGVSKNKIVV